MNRELRHKRVRAKVKGVITRPRLSVFRSLKGMFLQLVDDATGQTLASVGHRELKEGKRTKTEQAKELGLLLAEKAKIKKIEQVVFDRGGYKYHGRVKAVADGAREGGLVF
jgi:large subunit ribosomal protein L18